jgi:glutamine synthetase
MFNNTQEALAYIKEKEIRQLDVKVVDLQGRWRHMTYWATNVTERLFEEGTGISLSPYPGYRTVEQGDMKVIPDVTTAFVDPFYQYPTLSFICNIHLNDGTRYVRDPRFVLQQAERHLSSISPGATPLFSPELEFYIFDGASYGSDPRSAHYSVDAAAVGWSEEQGPIYQIGMEKFGQADQPLDRHVRVREEMVARIDAAGIKVKYHHHELGTPGQMEIEVLFDTPLRTADAMMIMKYMVKNTAPQFGKLATFMPKPLHGHAGNGIHYHQYLADGATSLFFDARGYGGLSSMAISYLGGLLNHTPALMGLGNASTNSYRRFSPNLAAPVKLFFGLSHRSSTVRIPAYAVNEREARVEYRMPDATANPYLIVAAQLMAGLHGVSSRMDPSALGYGPFDVNVYGLPAEEQAKLKDIPTDFTTALGALDEDRAFLKEGQVFSDELIDSWLATKRTYELDEVKLRPHPHEYMLYFDL